MYYFSVFPSWVVVESVIYFGTCVWCKYSIKRYGCPLLVRWGSPLCVVCRWRVKIVLTKRLELLLRTVLALPKASSRGFDCRMMSLTCWDTERNPHSDTLWGWSKAPTVHITLQEVWSHWFLSLPELLILLRILWKCNPWCIWQPRSFLHHSHHYKTRLNVTQTTNTNRVDVRHREVVIT